ncbi:hypothetical protein [Haladaptatus halobius]|uniref:hypothetical protein n=1 Tax=Haladaptatus halobius TaxID=2884875 RepID=UPI001D0B3AEC|nr:hypothetical protein [Haladaptatus halobius]
MSKINFRETARLKVSRLGAHTIKVLLMGIFFGGIAATPAPTVVGMLERQGYSTPVAWDMAIVFYLSLILIFAVGIAMMFSGRKGGQSLWRAFRARPIRSLLGIPMTFGLLFSCATFGIGFGGAAFQADILVPKWWYGMAALAGVTLFAIWMTDVSYQIVYGEQSEQELADAI